jgi:uncharacterized membrane protein
MEKVEPTVNRDLTAAYLSVLPGLGHLYKHHYRVGLFYLLLVTPVLVLVSALAAPATVGLSLLIAPLSWIAWAAYEAFHLPDWSHGKHGREAAAKQ